MWSIGYGKLLVGCVLAAVVLGGATVALGVGGFADSSAEADTDTVSEDGGVSVSSITAPDEVRSEDPLRVQVTVRNAGSRTETRQVGLQLNREGATELTDTVATTVELSPEDTRTVTLEATPQQTRPGVTTVSVSLSNSSAPATTDEVTVLDPPAFTIVDYAESTATVRGDTVTLRATVSNTGDYRGRKPVRYAVDADRNGQFTDEEVLNESERSLRAGESQATATAFATDSLEPGTYEYRAATATDAVTGTVTVRQPATMQIRRVVAPANVTRGETATVTAELRNAGDVAGNASVELKNRSGNVTRSRPVSLESNETTSVSFAVDTTNHSRATHNYTVQTAADNATTSMTVQDSYFEVSGLVGPNVLYVGDTPTFSATVRNTGEVSGTQSVQHRIDSDGDDRPEAYGVNQTVSLAPNESTRVTFEVEYTATYTPDYPVEPLSLETYVYGIYSNDTRASTAMSVKPAWAADSGGGSGGADTVSGDGRASLDEITQDKYGLYYDEVSAETRRQVEEIHERQPFAEGLAAAEVRTREEIARQDYGADVRAGEAFNFTALATETQQQVEADFDAQFQTESGDRIDSWDELARDRYGTVYQNLNESRQATVRASYEEQFE